MTNTIGMSRPVGVAQTLRQDVIDEAYILSSPVLLTGEWPALLTSNGQWCFLDCLRLLPRIVGPLVVSLPPGLGDFERQVVDLARTVYSQGTVSVRIEAAPSHVASFAAILSIGSHVPSELPWTTINSNGWIARVSSITGLSPREMSESNPIAALMAASLGVAEVFKRIYGIPAEVAPLLGTIQFSLFELSDDPSSAGPEFPRDVSLPDTLATGAGAIGNGLVLLLSQSGWKGRVHLVDRDAYAKENFGTCILLDSPDWVEKPKALMLSQWLSGQSGLVVTGDCAPIEHARSSELMQSMTTELVLNGLDDVHARHDTQLLWPSTLVDGGINAIGAAVVTHRLDQPAAACLRCAFELPVGDPRRSQSAVSGLNPESLDDLGRQLTEHDIALADEDKRPWLKRQLQEGKTICATIADASRLGMGLQPGFRPSVPFVATAAAALVVAEAAKSLWYPEAKFTHRFQIESLFLGPWTSISTFQQASPHCICSIHRDLIGHVARERRQRACTQDEKCPEKLDVMNLLNDLGEIAN